MIKGKGIENEHIATILCYFLVGIIWFFADDKMKKSSLVKFHSKQAINWFIACILLETAAPYVPVVGKPISIIIWICLVVIWVLGLVNALNAKEKEIPIIGHFAKKYLTY